MHLPHTLHRWHVWCYILRIHYTYLQSKCFLSRLYNDTSCFVQRLSTLLCLATHRFTRACHFSKQFSMHRPMTHLLQKYSVLRVCFFSEHTRHCLCFPLEGQCYECLMPNLLCFFGIYCQIITFPLYNTIISSTARCSVGLYISQNLLLRVSKIFLIFQNLLKSGLSRLGGLSLSSKWRNRRMWKKRSRAITFE